MSVVKWEKRTFYVKIYLFEHWSSEIIHNAKNKHVSNSYHEISYDI